MKEKEDGELVFLDKNRYMKQSNRLVEARYSVTRMEQRMMLAICSQLNSNAEDFETVRVSVDDMANFCGICKHGRKQEIKRILKKLLSRTVEIKKEDGGWYYTHWLQSAELLDEDTIEYRIDQRLKPELLQLKSSYLSTKINTLLDFKKDYSARLYLLFKKMLKIKMFHYDLEFFLDRFQLGDSYKKFSNFKNFIMDPSIEEINEKTDISVQHKYIKENRKVVRIKFIVSSKNSNKEEPEIPPQETVSQEDSLPLLQNVSKEKDKEAKKAKKTRNAKGKASETKEPTVAKETHATEKVLCPEYDSLINRGIFPRMARALIKKYDADCIRRNLRFAVESKNDKTVNLPGLIVDCIKKDSAGEMEKERKESRDRIEQRQKDSRAAYDLFHGTSLSGIGMPPDEPSQNFTEPQKTDCLSDFEVEYLTSPTKKKNSIILNHMKSLGLTLEDVKAGRRS